MGQAEAMSGRGGGNRFGDYGCDTPLTHEEPDPEMDLIVFPGSLAKYLRYVGVDARYASIAASSSSGLKPQGPVPLR